MNYGMYLSAAGVQTSMHRQDVYANNLANVDTVGFKPDTVFLRERNVERLDGAFADVSPHELLEQLGGGHLAEPTRVMLTQGSLVQSGNPLDVAIDGDGFLTVRGENGQTALTRDGRMVVGPGGQLVMATTGAPVLNDAGQSITLDLNRPVEIDSTGAIRQDGLIVDQLGLVDVSDPAALRKEGNNLLSVESNASLTQSTARIRQGYTESSAVDPIKAMMAMTNAAKAVSANARMMQFHDNTLSELFGRVGRIG
ncbi:MAG: flagellar hook basal-body protein [Phycisphaerales bacterium]|nr:flagellar hook basal-body protein [Phycisphaerales bacterium]